MEDKEIPERPDPSDPAFTVLSELVEGDASSETDEREYDNLPTEWEGESVQFTLEELNR